MVTDNMDDNEFVRTNCGSHVGREVNNSLDICYQCQLELRILRGNEIKA